MQGRLLAVGLGVVLFSSAAAWGADGPTAKDRPVVRVGEILIIGNTVTRADVIRRALAFAPDQPVTSGQLHAAQRNLEELNLFKGKPAIELFDSGKEPPYQDVLVRVEEKREPTGFGFHCLCAVESLLKDTFPSGVLLELEGTRGTSPASHLTLLLLEDSLDCVGDALLLMQRTLHGDPGWTPTCFLR